LSRFENGQALYGQHCAICHGASGQGNPTFEWPTLIDCPTCFSEAFLTEYIDETMPPGELARLNCTGDCAADVALYIREHFGSPEVSLLESCDPSAGPSTIFSPTARLTRAEYANSIRDLTGISYDVSGFQPDGISGAFSANIAVSLSEAHVDDYRVAAETIAERVTANIDELVDCLPSAGETCASEFIGSFGLRALRRPLTQQEQASYLEAYRLGFNRGEFRGGIRQVVSAMLQAPDFLYRLELSPRSGTGVTPLNSYELASRLSFLITRSIPDQQLLNLAASGQLTNPDILVSEATRLLNSPAAIESITLFHQEWLQLTGIFSVEKSPEIFPLYNAQVADALGRETGDFIRYVMTEGDGRFQTLLTAPYSVIDPVLASIYGRAPDTVTAKGTGTQIRIAAFGTSASAEIQLWVDDEIVTRWNLTTTLQEYVYEEPLIGQHNIKVYFTDVNSDATLDYILVGDERFEGEDQAVNTSLYIGNACVTTGGFSSALQCPGYIDFGTLDFGPENFSGLVNFDPSQRSGLLTQGAFLGIRAGQDQGSPIKRGLGFIQSLTCAELPPPPPNVVAELAEFDPNATTREIFAAHSNDPACRGCHNIIDPPGFAFERYDGIGAYRESDKGQPIDTATELVGIGEEIDGRYSNLREILEHVSASKVAQQCYATNWFRFAMLRDPGVEDACSITSMVDTMIATDGSIRDLLLAVVKSDAFRYGVREN
jgi:mono/diheme cytochrome c family protein